MSHADDWSECPCPMHGYRCSLQIYHDGRVGRVPHYIPADVLAAIVVEVVDGVREMDALVASLDTDEWDGDR